MINKQNIMKILIVFTIIIFSSEIIYCAEISETISKIKKNTIDSVKLKNGINYVDINGDGKQDIIMKGYRDHITAHSFSVYSIYVYKNLQREEPCEWQIVSMGGKGGFAGDDIGKYAISTHQGADCVLREIRLARFNKNSPYYLVIADRPIGESYIDSKNVKFTFYKLIYLEDENRFVYEKDKELYSKNKYCDVNKAFAKELGY
jgi:hypothetical protein